MDEGKSCTSPRPLAGALPLHPARVTLRGTGLPQLQVCNGASSFAGCLAVWAPSFLPSLCSELCLQGLCYVSRVAAAELGPSMGLGQWQGRGCLRAQLWTLGLRFSATRSPSLPL